MVCHKNASKALNATDQLTEAAGLRTIISPAGTAAGDETRTDGEDPAPTSTQHAVATETTSPIVPNTTTEPPTGVDLFFYFLFFKN